MSRPALISFHAVLALTSFALPAGAVTDARLSQSYGKLPLQFEANRGQTDKAVRFLSRGRGYSLYLTASEAVLVLAKPDAKAQSVALRMSLVGATSKPVVNGADELPGKANYFIGKDRSKWRTNVPTYAKVHYQNVYPGIDLVYYGNQRQLEYDFVVAPGADPTKIVLGFRGADKLEIDTGGDLVLHAPGGDIRQHKPILYQEINGVRQEIAGSYVRKGANRVGFEVAAYDRSQPLIIDPIVLSYSTFLGGNSLDQAAGIAVDANGNAYVTGNTWSSDFPTTAGAFSTTRPGFVSAFVTKVNPAGTALVYSTYLGDGAGGAIAVDADGNAYVTGRANPSFPTTPGAFQPASHGFFSEAFVTKLDPSGSTLVYSTFLGGSKDDSGFGIAVDANGFAYITGNTISTDFPTANALQVAHAGGGDQFPYDAFVTKLNPVGSALVYSTYLGGSGDDLANGIAVDPAGNAYVTGSTRSPNFPTTPAAFQPLFGGNIDAFVTKLDPSGSALVYSSYLGGSSEDQGFGIAVDGNGHAYVTGWTVSTDFPTANALQVAHAGGGIDAFVTKLDRVGSALYSTYLGGSGGDFANGIAVDPAGNAYVTGGTGSLNFPTTPGAFQPVFGGNADAFVTKLNSAGSAILYSTYFGGSDSDIGVGFALDAAGSAYLTGYTRSANFPVTPGAFQVTRHGCLDEFTPCDAFVVKFLGDPPPPAPSTTRSEEGAATQIGFWTSYGAETGSFSGGSIAASNFPASTALFSFTGTAVSWIGVKCNVCGIALVSVDGGAPSTVNMAGPNAPGSLASEPVFSASGLTTGNHTITIAVTSMSSSGGSYVALDAFDVTAGSATAPLLPPVVLPPPPVTIPPLPPLLGL